MQTCSDCGASKDDGEYYTTFQTQALRERCKACHTRAGEEAARRVQEVVVPEVRPTGSCEHDSHCNGRIHFHLGRIVCGIDFDAVWSSQEGLCASCKQPMPPLTNSPERVEMDHDRVCCTTHTSCGKCFRGLVHRRCLS